MDNPEPVSPQKQVQQPRRRPSLVLRFAGIIAIAAGIIFLVSGYTSHPILLTILNYIEVHFTNLLSPSELYALKLSVSILNFLVSLGGVVVISGGALLLLGRRTSGRVLVWLGGGMGILGLLFTMGEAYYYAGFSLVVFHAEYWIGLVLATFSFLLAKRGK